MDPVDNSPPTSHLQPTSQFLKSPDRANFKFPLPYEILSEIFLQCMDPESDPYGIHQPQFALSSVCTYWRSTALTTPGLWSYIPVICSSRPGGAAPIEARVLAFLDRSKEHPLDIHIADYIEIGDDHDWGSHSLPMIRHLMAHSSRWHFLTLELSSQKMPFFSLIKNKLPNLRYLSISMHNNPYDDYEAQVPQDTFLYCPRLQTLNLQGNEVYELFPLPWHQIRHISRMWLQRTTTLFVDHDLLSLETATFHIQSGPPDPYALPVGREYPNLRLLEIFAPVSRYGSSYRWEIDSFLASFHCPNLDSLHIGPFRQIEDSGLKSIISSCKNLHQLSFRNTFIPEDIVISTLLNTPHLKKLFIQNAHTSIAKLAEELAVVDATTNRPTFLPQMERLELFVPSSEVEQLVKALKQRAEYATHSPRISVVLRVWVEYWLDPSGPHSTTRDLIEGAGLDEWMDVEWTMTKEKDGIVG